MQSNAEDGQSKRLLFSLWKNIEFVKDQCIHLFWGDQIERIRVYHVWPGNNVFFFGGRLICGPDPRGLILTVVAICLSSWIFVIHVAINSSKCFTIIACTIILSAMVLVNLGMVSMIDPGIIPRNDGPSLEFDFNDNSNNKSSGKHVTINEVEIKLKYCRVCNIIRPPRCCHCVVCGNCIDKFDHHCPWLGQCIGLRNYRLYMMLIYTALALFIYIFVFSCKFIESKRILGLIGLLKACPETLMLAIFTFAASCFLGCLACYQVYLLLVNQTTYENYRHQYVNSQNPHDQGVLNNVKKVLLSPWSPSRVNFRAEARI